MVIQYFYLKWWIARNKALTNLHETLTTYYDLSVRDETVEYLGVEVYEYMEETR